MPAHRATLIAGFVELMFPIGNTLPALMLDRLGRRPTMMVGSGILSFCMLMITVLLSIGKESTSSAAIAFFFLYMLVFGKTSANGLIPGGSHKVSMLTWIYRRHDQCRPLGLGPGDFASRGPRSWYSHLSIEPLDVEFLHCDDYAGTHQSHPLGDVHHFYRIVGRVCANVSASGSTALSIAYFQLTQRIASTSRTQKPQT
jgi:hypothetical protein